MTYRSRSLTTTAVGAATGALSAPLPALLSALLLTAALLLAPLPAGAQSEEPAADTAAPSSAVATFGGSVEVGLVGLEAWVTDAEGRPVTGLEADDFTLRHDGEEVAITHFSEVRAGRLASTGAAAAAEGETDAAAAPAAVPIPGPEAPASPEPPPGHLIVYLDQDRLSPASTAAVRAALDGLLASGAVAAERVLVLRQADGLHLDAPLGSSADAVRAAVERGTEGSPHRGLSHAAELQQARDALMEIWEASEQQAGSAASGLGAAARSAGGAPGGASSGAAAGPRAALEARRGSTSSPACSDFRQRAKPLLAAWTRDRSRRLAVTLGNLDAAAGLLAALPGVKTLLYVSDGLDLSPGVSLAAYASDLCPGRSREREMEALAEGMAREFESLAAHLNTHGITLHALQASGLGGRREGAANQRATSAPIRAGANFETRQRQAERSGMQYLAVETGGRAIFNRTDLEGEMAAVGRAADHYYSLAYPLPAADAGREGRPVHRVKLTVDDPSLTVRHRRAVRSPDPAERVAEGLAGALHLGLVSNPHSLSLGLAGGADGVPLSLVVRVPLDRLVFSTEAAAAAAADTEAAARVELRALAQATGGEAAAGAEPVELSQEFRLRQPAGSTLADLAGERASLPLVLAVPPGPHRVAVALRDQASGEVSFVATALTVPGEAPEP